MVALGRTCPALENGKASRARTFHSAIGSIQGSLPPQQLLEAIMSIPNEKLQQILQEIGQKKAFAEQQLVIVRQQKVANSRESRMLQLTASEMESLPKETKVYEGVGKMFVCTPIPDVQKRLSSEDEKLKSELSNLKKKEDYLEKTYENSKNSIEQVLGGRTG
ncbi:hypothetical protein DPSP01_011889 [Paraphaeosphaeria sporulosa]